jgi:hypothetical protein
LDGIELQPSEEQLVEWLAGWDDWTVTTRAMLVGAARAAGPDEAGCERAGAGGGAAGAGCRGSDAASRGAGVHRELEGFANQQLARNLARTTVEGWENTVKAFASYVNTFPWQWTAAMVDEWLGVLRSLRDLKRSTIRGYSQSVRSFCVYVTDPAYEWARQCEARFGTHPVQVVHEWNTATHVQDNENDPVKRAFTRAELEAFFDYADEQVARIRSFGRKGWLPAFRDAVLLKTA